MRAWVLVMVMVCLSNGKVTGCSVGVIITVPKLRKASISCPPTMANSSELKYLLLFNDSCISQISLSKGSSLGRMHLDSTHSLFSSHFEVTAYNSGVYICKREVIYPPPFSMDCHTTEVVVAEKSLPTNNDTVPVANQSCPVRSPFIPDMVMWVGCGVSLVYSLSITFIIIVIWSPQRKLKRDEEDTSVYANTRPGEFSKPCKV
ncbi:uncharacterized protein LOC121616290 [Chelmon rostratus]|uniref:uncharacterized protein LOC121616290 n=1 Tax=Chelmon rostratus TaxID=109905 RepID=UPI001BE862B9|nr:uncharacterized protein LOC121616290 [Chelmon rostratus]